VDLKEIKELIALMKKNELSVFKMEREGFKITLKKGGEVQFVSGAPMLGGMAPAAAPAGQPSEPAAPGGTGGREITSPMVGTFYRSSSPESAPFVEVGTAVTEGMVVCIIEAMKVMNEIKAEIGGTVTEILAENGKPVEFGQALFKIR
jgi:acetyl-CoA carboxylase biotin carboxyl carrier protein